MERMLSRADDIAALRLIWAVFQLQSGEGPKARTYISFPPSAEAARLGDPEYVYPWNLETLVNELLATPKAVRQPDAPELFLRPDVFASVGELTNALRALENAEDGISLEKNDVFAELHRGIQRQFEWQRGFANLPRFYRSAFLYGSGESGHYFESSMGLSPADFMLTGFALHAGADLAPVRDRASDMSLIGVTPAMREATLGRISIGFPSARARAAELRGLRRPTAYRGSVLRDFPIITVGQSGEGLAAPLPSLIIQRITSGLYLDVVNGGEAVWQGIGKRFEDYCLRYLNRMFGGYEVESESEYGSKKNRFRTPDILASRHEEIALVLECKAKRMTFEARYSEDPVADSRLGYEEIAKGIFQIWRFWSHARRGIFSRPVNPKCLGMVVTTDPWLSMAKNLEEEVTAIATQMAKEADSQITEEDRRTVAVTQIDDVEFTLQNGNAESFIRAIEEGTRGDKLGWLLCNIHKPGGLPQRPYPFAEEMSDLLPWWEARSASD
ncbi:MAG TPA: hypothetical protein VF620_00505 [Allosphingosinicella sp.]